MYIQKIVLTNFRNYHQQEISLHECMNVIYGNNAQGKTNILEAIFLCAYGKSFRAKKDTELILFGEDVAKVEVQFQKIDRQGKVSAEIQENKTFYINDVKQNKVSNVLGNLHIVIFTPEDIEIIKGGPQKRRRFLDMLIGSLKPNYISILNQYNQILEQRNFYLKQIKMENKDANLLEIWDEQLAEFAYKIYVYRKLYMEKMKESAPNIHKMMTKNGKEQVAIKYISHGNSKETFLENLQKSRKTDIQRGFTGVGIHRDDFFVYINGKQVSIFGSQGQQRTVVLTLKLCEMQIIKEELHESPILLLDDFMSELDENRRTSFLEQIQDSQVIVTCTDPITLEKEGACFLVENGNCQKV